MKLVTSQGVVQLEDGDLVHFTTDHFGLVAEIKVEGPYLKIGLYHPTHLTTGNPTTLNHSSQPELS